MTEEKQKSTGVKIYERPKMPPSKVKAITIIIALLLLVAAAVLAFYLIV